MKFINLNNKSLSELNNELLSVLREQFNLKMQLSSKKLKKTHFMKQVRKKIAYIKTLITEKNKDIK